MRIFPGHSHLFEPLRDAIRRTFWPCLFGGAVDDREADLFSLPTRFGGLGIRDPVRLSECSFQASRMGCERIVEFMSNGEQFNVGDHLSKFSEAVKNSRQQQIEQNESLMEEVLGSFDERRARAVRRGIEGKCSNWLNVSLLLILILIYLHRCLGMHWRSDITDQLWLSLLCVMDVVLLPVWLMP